MISQGGHKYHGHSRHHGNIAKIAIIVVVLVVLFAVLALLAFSSSGASSITSGQSYSIGKGSTLRFYLQNGTVFSLFLGNSSSSSASIYASPYPILTNPITEISGSAGSSFNISTSGGSTADINLKIVSTNSSKAVIQLTQLPAGLSIGVSSLASVVVPGPLPQPGSTSQPATTITTITTTVGSTVTTTVSSTNTQSTTTIQQSQIPQTIINLAETTNEGVLMKNEAALYAAEPQCTESLYNQTLMTYTGLSPTGPLTFANVSLETPTSTNTTITLLPSGLYQVNYSVTVPKKSLSGTVISMEMSSSGTVSNLQFEGIFEGENYTTVEAAYKAQSAIGTCSAYIQ